MGTAYNPPSLAPHTDDSERTLCLKIAALLHGNQTGYAGLAPQLDDDARSALFIAASILYGAQEGDVTLTF